MSSRHGNRNCSGGWLMVAMVAAAGVFVLTLIRTARR
jgi:hypothetical protein